MASPREAVIAGSAVLGMVLLGVVSGWAGGRVQARAVLRLVGWGSGAMLITWLVGATV
jgi:VIT1/CCC1 family predicted Fe2+/Mn2+ transporter